MGEKNEFKDCLYYDIRTNGVPKTESKNRNYEKLIKEYQGIASTLNLMEGIFYFKVKIIMTLYF